MNEKLEAKTNIHDLPEEMLFKLFSYLSPEELSSIAATSKKIYDAVDRYIAHYFQVINEGGQASYDEEKKVIESYVKYLKKFKNTKIVKPNLPILNCESFIDDFVIDIKERTKSKDFSRYELTTKLSDKIIIWALYILPNDHDQFTASCDLSIGPNFYTRDYRDEEEPYNLKFLSFSRYPNDSGARNSIYNLLEVAKDGTKWHEKFQYQCWLRNIIRCYEDMIPYKAFIDHAEQEAVQSEIEQKLNRAIKIKWLSRLAFQTPAGLVKYDEDFKAKYLNIVTNPKIDKLLGYIILACNRGILINEKLLKIVQSNNYNSQEDDSLLF